MSDDGKVLRLFVATERCRLQVPRNGEVVFRRADSSKEFFLSDPSISSCAEGIARLKVDGDRVILAPCDTGSPVLLNGKKVRGESDVRPGDRLRLGFTTIIVQRVSTEDHTDTADVKTLDVATSFLLRREPLDSAANQLAQWSDGFDAMFDAEDITEAARVILDQLMRISEGKRGLVGYGSTTRALDCTGFTEAEAERVATWLQRNSAVDPVAIPSMAEVLGNKEQGTAIVGRYGCGDEHWCFLAELKEPTDGDLKAYRAMATLTNLLLLYERLHEKMGRERQVRELRDTVHMVSRPPEQHSEEIVRARFVFRSEAMQEVCRLLARAGRAPSPILITGEPGTGKQLAAEAIHAVSGRRHREMVGVSLVEIPETLIESQLFGHVAKIFSGAREHRGLISAADGSTLFLDEIGEVPKSIQGKLLRVLEYGTFWRIGANRQSRADLRIVSATNRDLLQDVRDGLFRQDLYDRLSVIPISIPPLRDRCEDIPLLVEHFLETFNARMGRRIVIDDRGVDYLCHQEWPDNIRGLRNCVERAVALADSRCDRLSESFFCELSPGNAADSPAGRIESIAQSLLEEGRSNQHRILRALDQFTERRTKGEWGETVQMSRPVFRRELKALMRFCVERELPAAYFERRITLRAEDWKSIQESAIDTSESAEA